MHHQKGFTLVEGLLVVLIVAALGAGGWYMYSRSQSNDTASTTSVQQKPKASAKAYLAIPEAGIRLPLTEAIKDAYYSVRSEGDNKYIHLSTRYFDNLKGFEACRSNATSGEQGLAVVDSAKVGDDHFGGPWTQADLEAFPNTKIGDMYYWITGAQAVCWNPDAFSESDPSVQKAQQIRKAFEAQSTAIEKR